MNDERLNSNTRCFTWVTSNEDAFMERDSISSTNPQKMMRRRMMKTRRRRRSIGKCCSTKENGRTVSLMESERSVQCALVLSRFTLLLYLLPYSTLYSTQLYSIPFHSYTSLSLTSQSNANNKTKAGVV